MIPWWKIDFGDREIELISEAIANRNISQGKVTSEFETRICNVLDVRHAIATTSGSVAIAMALMSAGVSAGTEVIIPNRTWIATAHAVMLLGAVPVLVDVRPDYPLLAVANVEAAITDRTVAVIPVHLNGRSVDMADLKSICGSREISIVEDAAQAFASENVYGKLGSQSAAGCFSLSVAKLISTGQGGIVVTNDEKIARKLKLIRTQGVDDFINTKFSCFGFNFRYNDLLAAVGLAQLEKLEDHIKAVTEIYYCYEDGLKDLPGIELIKSFPLKGEIPTYIEVLADDRSRLTQFLSQNNIQTRPFYPNLNTAPHLTSNNAFPNSDMYERAGLFLPSGPGQRLEDIKKVVDAIRQCQYLRS